MRSFQVREALSKNRNFSMADHLPAAVQSCRERVDQGVTDMVTQLDKDVFRKMQVNMYQLDLCLDL